MTATFIRRVLTAAPASVLMAMALVFSGGANASTTLTFQQGVNSYAGTQDTTIFGHINGSADQNFGSDPTLTVWDREQDTVNIQRALIKFNLGSLSSSTIIGSATLTLTYSGGVNENPNTNFITGGVTNSLYIVSSSDSGWTQGTATWNNANDATPQAWAGGPGLVAGTDYNATAVATAASPNTGPTSDLTMTFTLLPAGIAAINNWIQNPSQNAGFFITQPTSSSSEDQFFSSEEGTASFRPELTLITTPEPASLALLALGGVTLLRRRRA